MSGPDFIVDINGLRRGDESSSTAPMDFRGRPWLAVHWKCCALYSRIYRHREGTVYQGRCPRCGRAVEARVGPDGTSSRFFEAG